MDMVSELDITIINVIIDTKCIQFIPSNNIYHFLVAIYTKEYVGI